MTPKPDPYEVKNAEIEKLLNQLGRTIKAAMPEGYGFALEIFSYGEDGSMFYISSAQREDMIKALYELIARLGLESTVSK